MCQLPYMLPNHEANMPLLSAQDTAISLNNAMDQHHRSPTPLRQIAQQMAATELASRQGLSAQWKSIKGTEVR